MRYQTGQNPNASGYSTLNNGKPNQINKQHENEMKSLIQMQHVNANIINTDQSNASFR